MVLSTAHTPRTILSKLRSVNSAIKHRSLIIGDRPHIPSGSSRQASIILIMGQNFSTSSVSPVGDPKPAYRLVVVGGGAGGISVAARFAKIFGKQNSADIAVIEPSNTHYYQPLWTLVGAGQKTVADSSKPMSEVIPSGCDWIKDRCAEIDPKTNQVRLSGSSTGSIKYDYLVVAAGIQLDWNKIDGLVEALEKDPGVCSNYSPVYVQKTFKAIQALKEGDRAVFTFPNTPIKCAGAPQKIMYLADAYLRQKGSRSGITINYNTALGTIFGVKHYAGPLMEICKDRSLNVNCRLNLVKVDYENRTAFFENLDKPTEKLIPYQYNMLHVTPPMSAPKFLSPLSTPTSNGFVAVDPGTLQHIEYKNVFSLGDCCSAPTSKTAAAIASQNYIVTQNLLAQMKADTEKSGSVDKFPQIYDGYTSCPLVTGNNKCILAEFDYKLQPLETFPFSQAKERTTMYWLKREGLPFMYWNFMLKGNWSGPAPFRLFTKKESSQ